MAYLITSIDPFVTISSFQIPKRIYSAYWDAHIRNNTTIYLYCKYKSILKESLDYIDGISLVPKLENDSSKVAIAYTIAF